MEHKKMNKLIYNSQHKVLQFCDCTVQIPLPIVALQKSYSPNPHCLLHLVNLFMPTSAVNYLLIFKGSP